MTEEKIIQMLREKINSIKNNVPIFSYTDIKNLAVKDSVEDGMLVISLDDLQKFIDERLK